MGLVQVCAACVPLFRRTRSIINTHEFAHVCEHIGTSAHHDAAARVPFPYVIGERKYMPRDTVRYTVRYMVPGRYVGGGISICTTPSNTYL